MLVDVENVAEVQHEMPAPWGALGPEVERSFVVPSSRGEGIQRTRSVAGLTQGEPGRSLEGRRLESGRPGELQGAQIVVGEHLRVVLRPAQRLDPLGCQT